MKGALIDAAMRLAVASIVAGLAGIAVATSVLVINDAVIMGVLVLALAIQLPPRRRERAA